MAWIAQTELDILEKVFVDEDQIHLNKKNKFRQRLLGFYYSETKGVIHLCKNLDKFYHGIPMQSQYINNLRNIGFVENNEITSFGKKLLKVIYYNNNRLINQIRLSNNIETIDIKDIYRLEFLIYLVVISMAKKGIGYDGQAIDIVNNLENFFAQIQDSLNCTKKNDYNTAKAEVTQYVDINDLDKLFLIQIMNYSGYEINRFFKLSTDEKAEFWRTLSHVVDTCPNSDNGLNVLETKYYKMINPYNSGTIQKDVRHRVKYALAIHVINSSIIIRNNKIKLQAVPNGDALYCVLSFEKAKEIFESCQLKDIYNYVYQDHESIYFEEIVKYYYLDNPAKFSQSTLRISESLVEMQSKGINRDDKVILVNRNNKEPIGDHTMLIKEIVQSGAQPYIQLERCNPINREIVKDILEEEEQ